MQDPGACTRGVCTGTPGWHTEGGGKVHEDPGACTHGGRGGTLRRVNVQPRGLHKCGCLQDPGACTRGGTAQPCTSRATCGGPLPCTWREALRGSPSPACEGGGEGVAMGGGHVSCAHGAGGECWGLCTGLGLSPSPKVGCLGGGGGGVCPSPHSTPCSQWPYCRKRCSYCNFNTYVVPAVAEAAVRACLVQETRTLLRLSQVQSVTSVFFGGGTPSLASPHTVAAVLEAVAGAAHLPAGAEVTLEANPSSASTPRLAGFRAAGVNRLSIGVQSLDEAELQLLGREHTAAEARGAVEAARGLFPSRTSIDLIFGLPGQSGDAWARGLESALGLCDDHVSLYQLTLERGTALAAQVWGGALPTPPQDLLADMYQVARATLVAAGFRHYEVSNFARKGALSTHNLSYWRAEQYIGVGPGAHGRFVPWGEGGRSREARVQTLEPDAWMREVQSRGHGTRRREVLSPLEHSPCARRLEEVLALGLRTDEGVTHERPAVHLGRPGPAGLAAARPALPAAAPLDPGSRARLRHRSPEKERERGRARWRGCEGEQPQLGRCHAAHVRGGQPGRWRPAFRKRDHRAAGGWWWWCCLSRRRRRAGLDGVGSGVATATGSGAARRDAEALLGAWCGQGALRYGPHLPDKKGKTHELSSSTTAEEPEPMSRVLQGDDIQALAIKMEDLEKLHAPHLPHDAGRIPVRRKYLVRKYRPKEAKKEAHLLVAYPAFPKTPREPLTFSGPGLFGYGCEEILPHHILGSLQEFKMEALARGNTQIADFIEVSHPDVTTAALKEEHGGEKKKKVHQTPAAEHKALQNWQRNMTIRKKQEKYLGEILQRPENELLMSISEDYRQIQEERDLIDRSLPALLPGKGYRRGSEFWSQPERIGDELTGLTMTLTQRERGYPEPVTHIGKPHTVQMETGLKPPKRIPFRITWDKSLFLKRRRQELKSVLEELDFYKPDLDGLEVVGKGRPFTSVSTEPLPRSTTSEESETLSASLRDSPDVVPEAVQGPSLDFCGQPARWVNCTTSCRDEIGIAARLTFETLTGEKAESSLTVSNNGTAAIWYNWMRLPQQIPSRETKGKKKQCFYFDTRPGVILPGETRKFFFLFKSERAGIFSESWEFRTHPLLLGGALLQVTLWGIAVYEDKLADLREKLESDLAAREAAAIVAESLKELLVRIRTPERTPSPVDAYVTEEELFHQKNPELHYQHRVVKQLHELWRQHVTVPSAFEEKVPSGQKSTAEDVQYQESTSEALPSRSSTTEVPGWKNTLEEALSQMTNVVEEETGPSGWNLSFEDFKQAIQSIPQEEQREAALAQLNEAALELCVGQRPTQSDLLYQTCLQLWRETIDGLVSHSRKLRSLLGLPVKDTYADVVPEETVEVKQPIKGEKEDRITTRKEERRSFVGKDKEGKKRTTKTTGKEKEQSPSSRKLKDEKKLKSSTSSQEVKEGAQPMEAVTTDRVEPPQEQVDPILFGTYQEKLYIEVSLTNACIFVSCLCSLLVSLH
ncbi:MYCBP-associated protein isoform X3 [Tyto alba]|uniref:MYCBP-associated protein isoform X3 n=1 Tax=Tyto alba TaxID=56313 RepID=UPI001C662AB7|nr:MYCBP-associated protein isoform X3 [Tyto alba]